MKKLTSILLICLMALCFVGNNITFVHASPYSSAKFDIKDGNGKQQVIPAEFDFNPTTYVWDETIVSVCPISSANTVHFVGWSKEMNGLNNDGELSLVPMGNGTSYTPSDFDLSNGSITYYAIWANEYEN